MTKVKPSSKTELNPLPVNKQPAYAEKYMADTDTPKPIRFSGRIVQVNQESMPSKIGRSGYLTVNK